MDGRPQFESRFLVGNAQIDHEHERLFEIAGRVYDGLSAGDDVMIATVHEAIIELLEYTKTHFASEEGLMEAAGYPLLEEHRAQHRHLLSQVHDMGMRAEFEERYVPIELSQFIYHWLAEHILTNDKKLGEFLAAGK